MQPPDRRWTLGRLRAPVLPALALAACAQACGPAPGQPPPATAPPRAGPAPDLVAAFPDADSVRAATLAPGVRHVYLWLPRGPWAVHLVEVDRERCGPAVAALKAGPPLDARAPTSALAGDAMAAINADFFMTPGGTPVGAHVRAGRVLVGPGRRPVYAIGPDRWAGHALLAGHAAVVGDTVPLTQVNRAVQGDRHHPPRPGITLFDAWYGDRAPADTAGATVRVRLAGSRPPGPGATADGVGVVRSSHGPGETVALDADHVALQAVGPQARAWIERREGGDTVAWTAALVPGDAAAPPALEAVGGFPLLVAAGRGVVAEQDGVIESFGSARHPRTAVGWDAGRLLWVVVDGRQPPYSVGMSLPELEELFLRLGATDAINLDGGGSTTLAVGGRVVNRPSDAEGERPVANALALERCDPAG